MEKCFFCHLGTIEKENLIIDNDKFFSMYDSAPVSKGHALVIPKWHIVSYFDLSGDEAKILHEFIIETKAKIDADHNPDGYNIGINDGRAAGRTIDHFHIHIIPRYKGDIENPRGGVRNLLGNNIPPESQPEEFR